MFELVRKIFKYIHFTPMIEVNSLAKVHEDANKNYLPYINCKLSSPSLNIKNLDFGDLTYEYLIAELKNRIRLKLNRYLLIKEIDSGSCNECHSGIKVLKNPLLNDEHIGIKFVTSLDKSDLILITGSAINNIDTLNMLKTYNGKKFIIAIGECACTGGIFRDLNSSNDGIGSIIPVDIYIHGCIPDPKSILYGVIKALDKI